MRSSHFTQEVCLVSLLAGWPRLPARLLPRDRDRSRRATSLAPSSPPSSSSRACNASSTSPPLLVLLLGPRVTAAVCVCILLRRRMSAARARRRSVIVCCIAMNRCLETAERVREGWSLSSSGVVVAGANSGDHLVLDGREDVGGHRPTPGSLLRGRQSRVWRITAAPALFCTD